jgi:hypothetical protein
MVASAGQLASARREADERTDQGSDSGPDREQAAPSAYELLKQSLGRE